jgi:proline iminopeptidase
MDVMQVAPEHGHGQYAPSPDGKIYYETEGTGPIVILVAGGSGGTHTSYHGFFNELAKDHTVVYFDNIGRGRSDNLKDPAGYTVWRDAEDIEYLRQALKADKITVLGHSYGGMPAIAYALRHGDHLDHLVLSDTLHSAAAWQVNIDSCNHECQLRYPEVWSQLMAMRKKGVLSTADEYENLYSNAIDGLYWYNPDNAAKMYHSSDPVDRHQDNIYIHMTGNDSEWKIGGTIKDFDPRPQMRNIKVPTLICVGRADRVAPVKIAWEMNQLIPGSKLIVYERSGHRPWIEEKDLYFTNLVQFLSH